MFKIYRINILPLTPPRSILALIILSLLFGVALVRADTKHRVGLVVVHGDTVIKKCVSFSDDEITGYDVLEKSGLDLNADFSNSIGVAVCRIDHKGCSYPGDDCFCKCQDDGCTFWSYWHLDGSSWKFSSKGASNYNVSDGDVEGWVWGEGSKSKGGEEPPSVSFDDICEPIPTATDTPTPVPPTATPISTDTPEPTDTPAPTAIPTPRINTFTADKTTITTGESVVLSWDLSKAEEAYLSYNGSKEGVVSPGSKTVTPITTTVYALSAINDGGKAKKELTITVNPAAVEAGAVVASAVQLTTATKTAPAETAPETSAATTPLAVAALTNSTTPTSTIEANPVLPTVAAVTATTAVKPLPPAAKPAAITPVTATAPAIALASTPVPQLRVIHRNRSAEQADNQSQQSRRLLVSLGLVTVLILFLIVPVMLLGIGWLAWLIRRRKSI